MSDDILDQIDSALERNRRRFDPLGPDWDEGSVEGFFDTMRVRPARAGIEEGSTPVEAVHPVLWVQSDTSPLVSFADVAAGPSNGGDPATVDVRRRAQDGNDPVTAAMRAEVLRQGPTECEIDGQRQVFRGGEWIVVPVEGLDAVRPPVWNVTNAADDVRAVDPAECGHLAVTMRQAAFTPQRLVRVLVEGEEVYRGPVEDWPEDPAEPDAPLVDASSDTAPDVTLMPADQFDELVATLDEPDEVPALRRAWWKRWTR